MKKIISVFFYFLIFLSSIFSQKIIRGKIIDVKTKEPIPYANILLKGTHYGTISNEHGWVTFVLPQNKGTKSDTLVVSCIGYKTKLIPLNKVKNNTMIKMTPAPVILSAVKIKEKNKPTTVKELLKQTWKHYEENVNTDTLIKTYFIRDYAKHDKFFFSEKSILNVYDSRFKSASLICYNLSSSCNYLKQYKNELLSVGYWVANWTAVDNGKSITKYIYKHWRKSFIDTVYMKDDHLIFEVVYSNKLDKKTYRDLIKKVKLDPTWASLHFNAFKPLIEKNIEIGKVYVDKTDSYKVLKVLLLEVKTFVTFGLTSLQFDNYRNKTILSHEQEFYRKTNKDTSFYVDRFSEMVLTNISVKTDSMEVPHKDYFDITEELHGGYPFKSDCLPDTSFGNWNIYNTIENDSLDIKVNKDLLELKKVAKKSKE